MPTTRLSPVVLSATALVVLGVLAYWTGLSAPFIFDDGIHITDNHNIRYLWPVWVAAVSPRETLSPSRPVVNLSLAVNYAFGGYDVRGYHIFNLAVHILAALTLFGVVRRTLMLDPLRERFGKSATAVGLASALLWLVHPLQTESVTYIIQRAESMMGLFFLLTLYCLIRSVGSRREHWWWAGAIVSCALGMGSKEVMVTAPLVALLYDRVFVSKSLREAFSRRRGLYAGLALTWTISVLLISQGPQSKSAGFDVEGLSSWSYAKTQPGVIAHYLWLVIWPRQLCLDYGWPWAETAGDIVPGVILLAVLLAGTVLALVRFPRVGFLGLCFFLILAPSSSFIPLGDPIFEHRMYLPLAALAVLAVVSIDALVRWAFSPARLGDDRARRTEVLVLSLLVAGMALSLGWRTMLRNRDYGTEIGIWQDCLRTNPENGRALASLGGAFLAARNLPEAEKYLTRALKLHPRDHHAHFNLGLTLFFLGRCEEAAAEYRKAIVSYRDAANARNNLAWILATHPNRRLRDGVEAVWQAEEACRITRFEDPGAMDTLSAAYAEAGRFDEAEATVRKAIEQAQRQNEEQLIPQLESHLRLYQARKPWRDLTIKAPGATPAGSP